MQLTRARAFFVGMPDDQERSLISLLEQHYILSLLEGVAGVYRHIALVVPDMLFLASSQSGTEGLRLFRQLRHLPRICVVVCQEDTCQAFLGKGYQYRCSVEKNEPGLQSILTWTTTLRAQKEVSSRPSPLILPPRRRTIPSPPSPVPSVAPSHSAQAAVATATRTITPTISPPVVSPAVSVEQRPTQRLSGLWSNLRMLFGLS